MLLELGSESGVEFSGHVCRTLLLEGRCCPGGCGLGWLKALLGLAGRVGFAVLLDTHTRSSSLPLLYSSCPQQSLKAQLSPVGLFKPDHCHALVTAVAPVAVWEVSESPH